MKNGAFYSGVGFLFTHELDAMSNNEWLVLPLTSWLSPKIAELTFVLLHIPLFAILVALVSSPNERIQANTKFWLSVFLVVHAGLHVAFMGHESYEFDSWLSNFLIAGAAVCGFSYLLLLINEKSGA